MKLINKLIKYFNAYKSQIYPIIQLEILKEYYNEDNAIKKN